MLLRQCFAQSRLCGGSSAPLTEVRGTCSLCFLTCGFMLVFFSLGGRVFQADFLSFSDYESLSPYVRCVTITSAAFFSGAPKRAPTQLPLTKWAPV